MRIFLWMLMIIPAMVHAQTLEECQHAAEQNYPLIRQYDLIHKTTELTVANILKGWLPQVSASAQATYQSDVVSFPDQMRDVYKQMGLDMKGLRKDQYRIGIDINQTIYDGGTISNQKQIALRQGNVQSAQNEISMYNIRKRVNEMYFGLLLMEEQIKLNQDLQQFYDESERKLTSMVKNGTAAESDLNNIRAERLNVLQQYTDLTASRNTLKRIISEFCGIDVNNPSMPSADEASGVSVISIGNDRQRPEHRLFDAQLNLTMAQEKALNSALMPRIGVFAQGFYGYPGYNMFEDMINRNWRLNGMVGARMTWNIGALYTRKKDKLKLQLQRDLIENNREVFIFNNRIEQLQQQENMRRYQALMNRDEEIINLRMSVRKAAESKLSHGIIDVQDLIREINAENAARIQKSMHEISFLKEVYDNKYTTNQQ
jgi:outer membrane protein TolC